ncbi:unnamed protein product [Chrysoparadoxa australica]
MSKAPKAPSEGVIQLGSFEECWEALDGLIQQCDSSQASILRSLRIFIAAAAELISEEGAKPYLRAEEALSIMKESMRQHTKSVDEMVQVVEQAKALAGKLDRAVQVEGVGQVRMMNSLLSMHLGELEHLEAVTGDLRYDTSPQVLASYRCSLELRPVIDDTVLEYVAECRSLGKAAVESREAVAGSRERGRGQGGGGRQGEERGRRAVSPARQAARG